MRIPEHRSAPRGLTRAIASAAPPLGSYFADALLYTGRYPPERGSGHLWGRWRAERATYPTDNRSRVLAGGDQCTEGHLRCNYQAEERQMR